MASHQHAPHPHSHHDTALAEMIDLDAGVLHQYLFDATTWVRGLTQRQPTRRVLDVGAGTGVGTMALADRFTSADVVAVDVSAEMLRRVRERAVLRSLAGRVSTVQLDLDAELPRLGSFDVAWASAALHEVAHPDSAFDKLFGILNPGGVLAVVEMDGPPRFLEDQVGDGLEARIHGILRAERAGHNDHPDWTRSIERAGFTMIEKRAFPIDFAIDGASVGGRYAQLYLARIRPVVAPHLSEVDLVLLDELLAEAGPSSLRTRGDLRLRAGRTAWAARRP